MDDKDKDLLIQILQQQRNDLLNQLTMLQMQINKSAQAAQQEKVAKKEAK